VVPGREIEPLVPQLLYKPPGGDIAGHVGRRQGFMCWKETWNTESALFTAWVAVSDVKDESGPLCFVRGSHRWCYPNAGHCFNSDCDSTWGQIRVLSWETWREVPTVLIPGELSSHHKRMYYGSGSNVSQ
jgi:ectoine hydroxylase-related dioxygenase (phytanoyl-CoA dioxygenase family)